MEVDRALADEQVVSYRLAGLPLGNEQQYLGLAPGKFDELCVCQLGFCVHCTHFESPVPDVICRRRGHSRGTARSPISGIPYSPANVTCNLTLWSGPW